MLLFLDLASASLNYLENKKTQVYILDHHELHQKIPANIQIINPHLFNEEPVCSAGLSYLFAKSLNEKSYQNNPQFKRFIENEGLRFEAIDNFTKDSIQARQDLYKSICKKIWSTELLMK